MPRKIGHRRRGGRAQSSGAKFETKIETLIQDLGFTKQTGPRTAFFSTPRDTKEYDMHVFCGPSAYGGKGKQYCDLLVYGLPGFPQGFRIEGKAQFTKGSVDEKFPFLLLNIAAAGVPSVVVTAGKGARTEALDWLTEQALEDNPLLAVLTYDDFLQYLHDLY